MLSPLKTVEAWDFITRGSPRPQPVSSSTSNTYIIILYYISQCLLPFFSATAEPFALKFGTVFWNGIGKTANHFGDHWMYRARCGITDVETGVMDDKFLVEMEMLLGVKWIMNFECLEFYDLLKIWVEYFLRIFMCSHYYLTFRCGLLLLFTPHELYATFLFYEHFRFWSLLMQSMFFLLYSLGYPFI